MSLEETVAKLLQGDPDARDRLRSMGPEAADAAPALADAVARGDRQLRLDAMFVLEGLGVHGRAAIPGLVEALRDEDMDVAAQAAETLGALGYEAVPALVGALEDPDWRIRQAACQALGIIGVDATEAVGLSERRGNTTAVLLDIDDDSFLDAVAFGPEGAVLWRNRRGAGFEFTPLAESLVSEPIHAAVAADFDGDGDDDLVLVGHERHLLRNRVDHGNRSLRVALRQGGPEPIGALVRALYTDGTSSLQRYGSMRSSGFSQSLQPLHFGIPPGLALEKLAVRWPGDAREELFEAGPPGRRIELERGGGRR